MPWRLLVIDGADEGRYFPLVDDETTTLGHSRKHCDVFLHDLYVSRVHCQVQVAGDRVTVMDCDDTSGTFVNGTKVREVELRPGDVLRVGNSHMRLEIDDGNYEEAEDDEDPGYEEVVEEDTAQEPERSAEETVPAKVPHLPAKRLAELSGHTLGHYELRQVLGTGFHGTVFRARCLKSQQVVALKVLPEEFPAGDAEMKRFIQVLKASLPLRHQHLVNLYGAGKSGPYFWIASEYVEGESLADVLRRVQTGAKLNWRHGLRLAVHVGRALDFTQRQRLTHGNVTPANILIHLGDKLTKLNDLALARALEGSALQQKRMEKKLLNELPYLAPEQVDPKAFVDRLSDIYSLGAVVYARLTGQPPYEGESPEETIAKILEGSLVKPRELQPSIPPPFEAVVVKMLARNQEDRYQTPDELLAALERVAQKEEVPV